jgi:hypothetical protein
MTFGVYSAFNVTLSWVSSTIPRPKSKRAAALAMVNSLANCTHLFTSYLYPKTDAPQFVMAGATLASFCALCAIMSFVLRTYLKRENAKFDRAEGFVPGDKEAAGGQQKGFRYLI